MNHLNLAGIELLARLKRLKGKGVFLNNYVVDEINKLEDKNRCPREYRRNIDKRSIDDYTWSN